MLGEHPRFFPVSLSLWSFRQHDHAELFHRVLSPSKDSQPSQPSTTANAAYITDENDGQVYDGYTQDTPFLMCTTSIHRSMSTTRRTKSMTRKAVLGLMSSNLPRHKRACHALSASFLLYQSQDSWISRLTEFGTQKLSQKLFVFIVAHCLLQCVQHTPLANSARDHTLNRVFFQGS